MTANLKPYRAYKDSGVPWLGQVPEHWEVQTLGRIGRLFKGNGGSKADEVSEGIPCVRYGDLYTRHEFFIRNTKACVSPERAASYTTITYGDVLFAASGETMEDIGRSAENLLDREARCGGDVLLLHPTRTFEPGFLGYAADSPASRNQKACMGRGFTVVHIYASELKGLVLAVPPLAEQAAIVRFLDHADRRIRRYITTKRKLIALLNEQKQAILYRAVTRGLDPKVHLKPSGMEWLGNVPEHWDVRRLRTLVARIDQGVSPQAEAGLAEDGAWGVLKSGCVNRGVFRDTEHKRLPDGFVIDPSLAVEIGDVLVSRASGSPALVGSVGRIHSLNYSLILSDKTFRLIFKDNRLIDFMVAAMNTRYYRNQVEQAISGAEGLANNLPLSELNDFRIIVPPPEEAQKIAAHVQQQTRSLDIGIMAAERGITLIREYHSRLIGDVVTGKVDVREATAKLAEQLETAELIEEIEETDGELEQADLVESEPVAA